MTIPFSSILFLNTHFVPIVGWSLGLETNFHTFNLSNWFNSFCIAIIQFSSSNAFLTFFYSIWDNKAAYWHSFLMDDQILIPLYGFPNIYFLWQFFSLEKIGSFFSWYSYSSIFTGLSSKAFDSPWFNYNVSRFWLRSLS